MLLFGLDTKIMTKPSGGVNPPADHELLRQFSEELDSKKALLAAAMVEEQYRADPELLKRWGERGRAKSFEDAAHNLSFLLEAVALGDAAVFGRYILWLDKVLAGAGLPRRILTAHLELMAGHLAKALSKPCACEAARYIGSALAALTAAEEVKPL